MAEFIKVGSQRINVDKIRAVQENADGEVSVQYEHGGNAGFPADEGKIILDYADSHQPAKAERRPAPKGGPVTTA